jgi:LmbE family N-acetylglucosaminyl deacetylase
VRVLVFGAHPDDADWVAGGTAALYRRLGHAVKFVSVTNGDAGHHEMGGAPLARQRREEAASSGKVLDLDYVTLDNHDCVLQPTIAIRHQLVRILRQFAPDLVMTHRPYDYHPDHRITSQLVQDAVCTASVPNIVSDVPYNRFTPVVVYVWDHFQKPYPFIGDIVVDIGEVVERKIDALHCHTCQMYEFLPFIMRYEERLPQEDSERRKWLGSFLKPMFEGLANSYREKLIELYGKDRGVAVQWAEAFEKCEYGAPLSQENFHRLFPFFGAQESGGSHGGKRYEP